MTWRDSDILIFNFISSVLIAIIVIRISVCQVYSSTFLDLEVKVWLSLLSRCFISILRSTASRAPSQTLISKFVKLGRSCRIPNTYFYLAAEHSLNKHPHTIRYALSRETLGQFPGRIVRKDKRLNAVIILPQLIMPKLNNNNKW